MHSSETPAEKIYETDQTTCGASGCLHLSAGFSAGRRKRLDQTTKSRLTRGWGGGGGGGLRPDKHSRFTVFLFLWYLLNSHQLSSPLMADAFLRENLNSWHSDQTQWRCLFCCYSMFCCLGLKLREQPAAFFARSVKSL